jgi:glutathione S-transferase
MGAPRPRINHRENPMAIEFYCGSGSPYAWRVWLALEHKALAYELRMISFADGDLQKPEYANVNPRRKVPAIVDDGYAIYESAAIVEYLEDAYRGKGPALFPDDVKSRASARRLIREADEYLTHALEGLLDHILFKPAAEWDAATIAEARDGYAAELARFAGYLRGDFFVGEVGAADHAIYPLIALVLRIEAKKKPDLGIRAAMPAALASWMARVEALPYFARTYPPHWKSG